MASSTVRARAFLSIAALVGLMAPAPVVRAQPAAGAVEGILLLAHGGAQGWNQRVLELAATIDGTQPLEVAFGMASRPAIQSAIDRLVARGVSS